MAAPLVPIPRQGEQSSTELLDLSRRALQTGFQRLTAGDYRQAANHVRMAVDLSTEAIAEQRDWQHDSEAIRSTVISQLCVEVGSANEPAETLHIGRSASKAIPEDGSNLAVYEDIIRYSLQAAEEFVQVVELLMKEPPRPFTIASQLDAHRIAQLTGYEPDLGVTDARGFANFKGEARQA